MNRWRKNLPILLIAVLALSSIASLSHAAGAAQINPTYAGTKSNGDQLDIAFSEPNNSVVYLADIICCSSGPGDYYQSPVCSGVQDSFKLHGAHPSHWGPYSGKQAPLWHSHSFYRQAMACRFVQPRRGDVIVFIYPEDRTKDFIKRVVGIAGDTIEIRNKKIILNGQEVTNPHAHYYSNVIMPGDMNPRDNMNPVTVPPGHLFVMGDNRDYSHDSRFLGLCSCGGCQRGGVPDLLFGPCQSDGAVSSM